MERGEETVRAAEAAERAARELMRQADALLGFAFECRHTDPVPDAPGWIAEDLEAAARELRAIELPRAPDE